MMAADLDLSYLTSEEKETILSVLQRDTELRALEQVRIKQLKEELRALRMKGVNRGDRSATESCSRCCEAFGWFFNRGVICVQCLQKVCDKCQHVVPAGKVLCVFCMKQIELEAKCATWFYAKVPRKSSTDRVPNDFITGTDILKSSLLRVRPSHLTRRSSAVGTTLDEVRRALVKSSTPDADVSFSSCEESADRKFASPNDGTAYPQEDDKKLLKDLLDLRNFGLSSSTAKPPVSSAVKVQQVYSSKYADSDSSDDDSAGEVDSPHLSSCSGSAFRKSDSIRSSLQTNCSYGGGGSGEGATSKGLASGSLPRDNSSHLPYPHGQPEDPSNQNLIRYAVDERCNETSRLSGISQAAEEDEEDEERLADDDDVQSSSSSSAADDAVSVAAAVAASTSAAFHAEPTDEADSMRKPYKTTGDFSRGSYEENNNTSPPLSTSSSQPGCNSAVNNPRSVRQSVSSLGSPISASMPSIAALAVNLTNNKHNAGVNGTASDEETEDIGEMFALYGGSRRANSQTNLNKLSLYSNGRTKAHSVQGSKESITSCYSDAGEENYGKYPVTGEILFGLNYNYTLNILEITIRRCKDLAPVDPKRNRSDPYVKTYLLPDRTKTGKRKTRVKKHTLNPVFDEIVKYQIMKSELETRTLNLMVWNNDRFGRNDFLGEINIPLDYYPFDNPTPVWHKLQDRVPSPVSMLTYKGDLNLCLKFVSAEHISGKRRGQNYKGELQVIVKEARNLTAVRSNGFSDPFCKGYLLPEKSQKSKQKTTVVKKNCSPKWNHTFIFENVSWDELQQRSLELTLWDFDRLTSNDFLGGVRLNLGTSQSNGSSVEWMDSKGDELALWQAMLDRPNCWIEGTLLLRLNMNQRK